MSNISNTERPETVTSEHDIPNTDVTPAGQPVDLIRPSIDSLWRGKDSKTYVTLKVDDHFENLALDSDRTKLYIRGRFYRRYRRLLSDVQTSACVDILKAEALFDGQEHDVYLRVANLSDTVYVDLCNHKWEVIEIDEDGFRKVPRPSVKFIRRAGMERLPDPSQCKDGHGLRQLQKILNVPTEDTLRMPLDA